MLFTTHARMHSRGHELLESITAARTLGKDVLRAEEGVKADGPRVDGRVVARARQAYPMSARAEVAVERPVHSY